MFLIIVLPSSLPIQFERQTVHAMWHAKGGDVNVSHATNARRHFGWFSFRSKSSSNSKWMGEIAFWSQVYPNYEADCPFLYVCGIWELNQFKLPSLPSLSPYLQPSRGIQKHAPYTGRLSCFCLKIPPPKRQHKGRLETEAVQLSTCSFCLIWTIYMVCASRLTLPCHALPELPHIHVLSGQTHTLCSSWNIQDYCVDSTC